MIAILFLLNLSDNCPPGLIKVDDRCIFGISYLERAAETGPQKPFDLSQKKLSPEMIDLGRYLFFDPILSGDGTVSCASCHQPGKSFTDGLQRSVGIGGSLAYRSAPSLWNVAFSTAFF